MKLDWRSWWGRARKMASRTADPQTPGGRGWRSRLVMAALFLFAALCGFWLAFPAETILQQLRREVYRESGLVLTAQTVEFTFPFTLRLETCRIAPVPQLEQIEAERIEVSPAWRGLLTGDPGVVLQLAGWGGTVHGVLSRDGNLEFELQQVELEHLGTLPGGYQLQGRFAGNASGNLRSREGVSWDLQLAGLQLNGLQALGISEPLSLGEGRANGSFQGQTLKVEGMTLGGGSLEATGNGNLILGSAPSSSRVAATLQLRASESAPPLIVDLLSLSGKSPDPQGWYVLRLSGRLDAPTLR